MVFTGTMWKDGKFWLVCVPSLEIVTQGKSRQDALRMIADAVECHVDRRGFHAKAFPLNSKRDKSALKGSETFMLTANNDAELMALFLRRQRHLSRLTVRQVARKIGYASPSAYAQYESGKHLPGLEKVSKFLAAMNPRAKFAVEVVNV